MNALKRIALCVVVSFIFISPSSLHAVSIQWTGTSGTVPNDGMLYYINTNITLTGNLFINGWLEVRNGGTVTVNSYNMFNNATGYLDLHSGGLINSTGSALSNSGLFSGFGTINGPFTNDGDFRPGDSPGVTTIIGDYTENGTLYIEIAGTDDSAPTEYDYVTGVTNLTLGGSSVLSLDFFGTFGESDLTVGDSFDIIRYTGLRSGTFGSIDDTNAPLSSGTWSINYDNLLGGGVQSVRLSYIPEPATVTLMLLGAAGLVMRKRKQMGHI
jgi:hypothetical protein